jgi:hypothetical protein
MQSGLGYDDAIVAASWKFLREFTLKEFKGLASHYFASKESRQRLREALLVSLQRCCDT